MRYRLRTLMIVLVGAVVVAALIAVDLNAKRPLRIVDSSSGQQAIERLSAARSVRVNFAWPPNRFDVELSQAAKAEFESWLKKAVHDEYPFKLARSGKIILDPPTSPSWDLLEINDFEMGLCVDDVNYWR